MTEFTKRVAANADDCYCTTAGSNFQDIDYCFVGDTAGTEYVTGLRFTGVTIPQGATIDSAILTLKAYQSIATTTVNCKIYCIDADNYDGFSDNAGDRPNDATRTTAYAEWTPGAWTANTSYDTSDFSDAVQEVVDRVGWESGNALSVVLDGEGSGVNARRNFDAYNLGEGTAALLTINYTTAAGPANLKTYNTNAAANIKTINTNAIANVKSLNTNI